MLWRVRTTLPDRPGALAVLAQHCGAAGVNILGLQIFPGVEAVTDELVLRVPDGLGPGRASPSWSRPPAASSVSATPCTEARAGRPADPLRAGRPHDPGPAGQSFPEVVAGLFDAEADPVDGALGPVQDVMEHDRRRRRRSRSAGPRRSPPPSTPAAPRWPTWSPTSSPAAAPSPRLSPRRPAAGSAAAPRRRTSPPAAQVAALVDGTMVGLARLVRPEVERAGRPTGHAATSTRPGSAAGSAPGCWSTRPAWPPAGASTRSC